MNQAKVISALKAAWEREIEAAHTYRILWEQEEEERRKRIFLKLAEAEEEHARLFAERMLALGGAPPRESHSAASAKRALAKAMGADAMLRQIEAEEERSALQFAKHAKALSEDEESHALFTRIEEEEQQHASILHSLKSPDEPRTRLEAIMKGEKWHRSTGSWIGDAIYGLNDGLGAVFGVVSGMAGASSHSPEGHKVVLAAGSIAMLASALSMGTSAFMAARSEREVYQAEIGREKREIELSPEHEIEELQLLYQLKGLTENEAVIMANRLAEKPEQFLKTMVQEELGLSEQHFPNPVTGAITASLSTAIGGAIPVLPFFFTSGMKAVFLAALVGMAGHFAVGAAKSLVTARSWWRSGLEMTLVAVLSGVITFGLGMLFHIQ